MTDDAVPDVFALIESTRGEPGHLEGHLTARDEADLELLHAGTPQHAQPSRRSSRQLGWWLVGATLVELAALAVILAAEIDGSRGWRTAEAVAAWVLLIPFALFVVVAVGCLALAAFEAWYERRSRGGGSP